MIYNPFQNIPVRLKSHVRGWAAHWAECLNTTIYQTGQLNCPTLYIEHGVNFGGTLNLFGGVSDELVDRLIELEAYTGNLVSLDLPMPDYCGQLAKRLGQATCSPKLTAALLAALDVRLKNSTTLTQYDLRHEAVAIGDSHATAYADKSSAVIRTNGLTLHGALQKGVFIEQIGRLVYQPRRVTLVCGSIDIRHHIGRQSDPKQAVFDLCKNYLDLVQFIEQECNIEVEIAAPVPVEWEGRKIPQTGFYKKTPFTGTLVQRQYWTKMFIDKMRAHGLISPPFDWYLMDPVQYANNYMELNSSVHIAPPFYRRFDWGQL